MQMKATWYKNKISVPQQNSGENLKRLLRRPVNNVGKKFISLLPVEV